MTDSRSFDKRTPLGAIRSPLDPSVGVTEESAADVDRSSVPRLSRAALRKAGGTAAHAAERPDTSSTAVRVLTIVLALVLCLMGAAFVGLGLGNAQTQLAGVPEVVEAEPPPKTVSGVEVREGMRAPSEP